jgi:hypothetical protein
VQNISNGNQAYCPFRFRILELLFSSAKQMIWYSSFSVTGLFGGGVIRINRRKPEITRSQIILKCFINEVLRNLFAFREFGVRQGEDFFFLFCGDFSCWIYRTTVMGEWNVNTGHCWNCTDREKPYLPEKSVSGPLHQPQISIRLGWDRLRSFVAIVRWVATSVIKRNLIKSLFRSW